VQPVDTVGEYLACEADASPLGECAPLAEALQASVARLVAESVSALVRISVCQGPLPSLRVVIQDSTSRAMALPDGRPIIVLTPAASKDLDVMTHELTHLCLGQAEWPEVHLDAAGRASTQHRAVAEGVADALAAWRSGLSVLARQSTPATMEAKNVALPAKCPESLNGQPHDDAQVVSSALWAAMQASTPDLIATAAAQAARKQGTIADFDRAMKEALTGPAREAFLKASSDALLVDCGRAIPLRASQTFSAERDRFVLPGTRHTKQLQSVRGPQSFVVEFDTPVNAAQVSVRSAQQGGTVSVWFSTPSQQGTAALSASAIPSGTLVFEQPTTHLEIAFVSSRASDAYFNDVTVTGQPASTSPLPWVSAATATLLAGLWLFRRWRSR
jgi:hypothetical protein